MTKLRTSMPEPMIAELDAIALAEGLPRTHVIRDAVRTYIRRYDLVGSSR